MKRENHRSFLLLLSLVASAKDSICVDCAIHKEIGDIGIVTIEPNAIAKIIVMLAMDIMAIQPTFHHQTVIFRIAHDSLPYPQNVLATYNTYLMQNDLTRPDCCFIMTANRITPLCRATHKEIREAHNLEMMYVNGAFGS